MRLERAGLKFRVELYTDEPGVIRDFDDFGQDAVGGFAGEDHAGFGQLIFIFHVYFIAVPVALGDIGCFENAAGKGR